MKFILLVPAIILAMLFSENPVTAQQINRQPKKMFRFYEDNDYINLRLKGTDEAYTNGTRLDLFYEKNRNTFFFLNKWMPLAGKNAINTYGWGIMQSMYTPEDITKTEPDPLDFPYAGVLFITHSIHSSNAVKKYSFNTELQMGIIGPLSLAKESQIAIHKLIKYKRPMGWDHQLPTDLALNINFSAEKQLWQQGKWFEIIGGTQLNAGTLLNSFSTYSIMRIGKMNPYFNGYISRYSSPQETNREAGHQWQAFILLKPRVDYIHRNSLVNGGLFNGRRDKLIKQAVKSNEPGIAIPEGRILAFDYGFSLTCDNTSISVIQKVESSTIHGAPQHEVGNISLYKTW